MNWVVISILSTIHGICLSILLYYRFPGLFFGIGNENPAENAESYTVSKPYGRINLVRDVGHHISAGFKTFYEYTRLVEIAEGGLLDTEDVSGETGGHNTGIGPGWLLTPAMISFTLPVGGKQTYRQYGMTICWAVISTILRSGWNSVHFHAVWKQQVLAWNLLADLHPGNPPFNRMAMMGGQFYMRGNFEGRLRDKHLLTTQMEYRVPVWRFIRVTGFGGNRRGGRCSVIFHLVWIALLLWCRSATGTHARQQPETESRLWFRIRWRQGFVCAVQ